MTSYSSAATICSI